MSGYPSRITVSPASAPAEFRNGCKVKKLFLYYKRKF